MACAVRSRIDKWDLIKFQSFCMAKDTVIRRKWEPTDWEKIFTILISDNIIYKLRKLDSREPNNLIKKMRYKTKERILN